MANRHGRTSSHWGSYWITTENNEVVAATAVDQDPAPSRIGQNYVGILRNGTRILRPAVRKGWLENGPGPSTGRGSEPYVEVSWETAFQLIAKELDRVRTDHGNEAIYGGSYGWGSAGRFNHAQSQVHRFLNSIGGYTRSLNTYSHAADEVVLPHLVGDRDWFLRNVPAWSNVAEHGEFVLAFGGLPRRSVQVNPGGVGAHVNGQWQDKCAEAGVEFTVVTPSYKDSGAKLNAEWMPVRPNTDVALMLGLCHTMLVEDRYDKYFVEKCCVGFDQVKEYLLGQADGEVKDAAWAASICGVDAEHIRELSRKLTAKRSLISVTWSLQRQHHGEMPYWAGITLAAMAGSMGKPGGGFGTGYSSMHNAHVHDRFSPAAALPQGRNGVSSFIPVARISDMLLNPGKDFDYNGKTQPYPHARLLYWIGGNPFHHHQDLNRMLRAWQRPETIIVHEPFWNAMTKHADIVMPVATSIEREDFSIGMADNWLSYMSPVAQAPEGILTDYEVFARITELMGCAQEFTEGRTAREWVAELYGRSIEKCAGLGIDLPDFEAFKALGAINLPMPRSARVAFADLREDPEQFPLKTPSGKIELFSETVASFGYDSCPGYARWMEPAEWLGSPLARKYPLHLVSPQPDGKLHSQMDHGRESRRFKVKGRTVIKMPAAAASARGIENGDIVRVFSARGECLAAALIVAELMPNVVQLPTGAWYDPLDPGAADSLEKHGNPNVLTLDIGTSQLAQGPSSHTCLVDVALFEGPVPEITAFDPPELLRGPVPSPYHLQGAPS